MQLKISRWTLKVPMQTNLQLTQIWIKPKPYYFFIFFWRVFVVQTVCFLGHPVRKCLSRFSFWSFLLLMLSLQSRFSLGWWRHSKSSSASVAANGKHIFFSNRIYGRAAGPEPESRPEPGPSCVSLKSDRSKDAVTGFKVQPVSAVERWAVNNMNSLRAYLIAWCYWIKTAVQTRHSQLNCLLLSCNRSC